jgi:hypothetical protein
MGEQRDDADQIEDLPVEGQSAEDVKGGRLGGPKRFDAPEASPQLDTDLGSADPSAIRGYAGSNHNETLVRI